MPPIRSTIRTVLLLLSLFCGSFRATGQENYYFSNLTLRDGLSQISVICMLQDRQGYMWFGTRNGLNRYNGYSFETFYYGELDNAPLLNNHIICLAEDPEGYLWAGTRNGLNRLDLRDYSTQIFRHDPGDSLSLPGNYILSLFVDPRGKLWIGTTEGFCSYDPQHGRFDRIALDGILTRNNISAITGGETPDHIYLGTTKTGVVRLDTKTGAYKVFRHHTDDKGSVCSNNIRSLLLDSGGNLWVGTKRYGISCLRAGTDRFIHVNTSNGLPSDEVRTLSESPDAIVYAGTYNGVCGIDLRADGTACHRVGVSGTGSLSHFSVFSAMFDAAGTFWVGTYAGGINYASRHGNRFRFFSPDSQGKALRGVLGPMVEQAGTIYIATEGNGLLAFDPAAGTFSTHRIGPDGEQSTEQDIIRSIALDGEDILCTVDPGLIYRFDTRKKKFFRTYDIGSVTRQYSMLRDSLGALMIAGVGVDPLVRIEPDGSIRRRFEVGQRTNYRFGNLYSLLEVEKGIFLCGSRNRGLVRFDLNGKCIQRYGAFQQVNQIVRDSRGNVWLTPQGDGLVHFDPETEILTPVPVAANGTGHTIFSIVEGEDGSLWMTSSTGVTRFDPQAGVFKHFTLAGNIEINEFTYRGGLKTSSGDIIFSGDNGLIMFSPERMSTNMVRPPVVLNNLYVNNMKIRPGGEDGILSQSLQHQSRIVLRHDQSNIAIEYAALNYASSQNNRYAYMLEGFDREWVEVGNRRTAYYTNLPPGKYLFRVRGSNNDGLWNDEGAQVGITVLPPFWRTGAAMSVYLVVFFALLSFLVYHTRQKRKLENAILLEKMEAEAQEEFNRERNKLFINFSHELRSPLTLIISPLEELLRPGRHLPEQAHHLQMMHNNSLRLLRITNNLLDFTKHEHGHLKLRLSEGDVMAFGEKICGLFTELARVRDITFTRDFSPASLTMWFDQELLEKVFFNLLSNAFKNTPNGGTVEVRLRLTQRSGVGEGGNSTEEGPVLLTEVEDSGPGIPEAESKKIFAPFYQVAQNEHSVSGTGLGLSLTQAIVEMHHGEIRVGKGQGSGALFRFTLPTGNTWFTADQVAKTGSDPASGSIYVPELPAEPEPADPAAQRIHTVMVVEDNADMRHYIASCLSPHYHVMTAGSAEEALRTIAASPPDLIVSDMMMQGMDGIEMSRRLKSDKRTGHIPIVMVTARAAQHDVETGLGSGVDDYITKPFNASVLLSRIRNLLSGRERLKRFYGKDFSLAALGIEVSSGEDERFLLRVYDILASRMGDAGFNLSDCHMEAGLGRTSFYQKVKRLTGHSPGELTKRFRLDAAAKLLRESDIPVSDISIIVGFGSLSHFSRSFKAVYGIMPSGYREQR